MPLFKGKASKAKPQKAIDYVTNPNKAVIVTSQALDDNRSYSNQFKETCDIYGKGKGVAERKYYHFKLSCNPTDNPAPQQSHELAEKLAQRLFPDHECVIATHDDTDTLHSHIIVNAVSFETGKKLHLNDKAYRDCKDLANTLGAEMGLSTIDWRAKTKEKRERAKSGEAITNEAKYLSSTERNMAKNKELSTASWKEALRYAIDEAKVHTTNRSEFQNYLQEQFGVTMPRNTAKTVSFVHPAVGETYAIRGNKLGADYTATAIDEALQQNVTLLQNETLKHNEIFQQNKNYNDRRVLDEGLFTTTQHRSTEHHATGASYTDTSTTEPTITGAEYATSYQNPSPTIPTPTIHFPHGATISSQSTIQDGNGKRITPRSVGDVSAELGSISETVSEIAGRISTPDRGALSEDKRGNGCNSNNIVGVGRRDAHDNESKQRKLHRNVEQFRGLDEPKPPAVSRPVDPAPQPEPVVQQKPKRNPYRSSR